MASNQTPAEPPPSYEVASQTTGTSTASHPTRTSRLEIPQAVNGIPPHHRKSMEDEGRKLPAGWIRQFDAKENHQFFVDTRVNPPKSIWHHPYDDEEYLSTLSSEERERIQEEDDNLRRPTTPASVDEKKSHKDSSTAHGTYAELPPRPGRTLSTDAGKKKGLGERLKEKATGMTKEEREVEKRKRAEEERQYYEMHMKFRRAMAEATRTQQPVFFTKDRDGKDVYVEPPPMGYGGGFGGGYGGGYGGRGYGVNPYGSGVYNNPNARFVRPQQAYGRPYGAYGGGYGMGLPIAGGLLGGALLGGLFF